MRYLVLLLATVSTSACSRTSKLLNQISAADSAMVETVIGKSDQPTCALATDDGKIRLIAARGRAVVDVNGSAELLPKISDSGLAGETFGDKQTNVAVSFVADALAANGEVIGHKAGVVVTANGSMEHFFGMWTC